MNIVHHHFAGHVGIDSVGARIADVVAAWLLLIIIDLLILPGYFDIALRDFGLLLGALALGRLSREFSS